MQAIQSGPRALRRTLFAGASGLAVALSLGVGAAAAQTVGGQVLSATDPKDPYSKAVSQLLERVNSNRRHGENAHGLASTFKKWFNK